MTQLRLSIACTCRCAEPDCAPCQAYTIQHRRGYVAIREERAAAKKQLDDLRLIFGGLRVAAEVMRYRMAVPS
jgi:hypothetical protein